MASSNSNSNSNNDGNNSNGSHNQTNGTKVNGNSETQANTSFTSIEVSNGQEEAIFLSQDDATERSEIRRLPTENWANEMSRTLFRRSDDHCYTKDTSSSNSDEKKND